MQRDFFRNPTRSVGFHGKVPLPCRKTAKHEIEFRRAVPFGLIGVLSMIFFEKNIQPPLNFLDFLPPRAYLIRAAFLRATTWVKIPVSGVKISFLRTEFL